MPQNRIILLIIQILIPLSLILWLTIKNVNSKLELILDNISTALFLSFIIVAGRWDIFSFYLQYIIIFIYGIVFIYKIRMFSEVYFFPDNDLIHWLMMAFKIIVIVVFYMLNYYLYLGYQFNGKDLTINSPFKKGNYYVIQGGSNHLLNRYSNVKSEKYAVDLVQLSALGIHAKSLNPTSISDYNIFGDTLISPVDGQVIRVVDKLKKDDSNNRRKKYSLGNYIVIQYANNLLVLSNLEKNSAMVTKDMIVTQGQVLAQIGESGSFKEPLLHLFAVQTTNPDSIKVADGIPLLLDGRFPVKNTILKF